MGRRRAEATRGAPGSAAAIRRSGGSLSTTDESEIRDVIVWTAASLAAAPAELPAFGAAPCALKAAAAPLVAAAREALATPAGAGRDAWRPS
jgi:hypothetical protein